MDFWVRFILDFLKQIPLFFLNPVLYILVLLLFMQYRREVLMQRRLFNVRVTSVVSEMAFAMGKGILGGLLVTLLLLACGVSFSYKELLLLEGITVFLAFFNLRFLHMGLGAGVLLALSYLARLLPDFQQGWADSIVATLQEIHPLSLTVFAGALFILEGIGLARGNREGLFPIMVDGKRGRAVGAYEIRRFTFFPLILFLAGSTGTDFGLIGRPDWWPWFTDSTLLLSLFPFPAVTGYVDVVKTGMPKENVYRAQKALVLLGLVILASAWLLSIWEPLMLAVGLLILLGNEGILWLGRRKERGKPFFFGRLPQGIRVMAVMAGSPAEEMGIEAGDVLLKVNGVAVSHQDEIYPLLQRQSAFCKMEVLNEDGNIKYVHRSMYQGEPHDLGLIPAPDQYARHFVKEGPLSLVGLFYPRVRRIDERPINQDFGQGKDVSM